MRSQKNLGSFVLKICELIGYKATCMVRYWSVHIDPWGLLMNLWTLCTPK